MHPSRNDELDQFKRQINLTEYAAALGYALERRESSRNSIVMRGPGDDKVVIALNGATGHWMYFSVRDEADNGTIVDFTQKRLHLSLDEATRNCARGSISVSGPRGGRPGAATPPRSNHRART